MVVASTILSMGVITVCAMSTRSLSRVRLNREREVAWDLLDRQLTMIEYAGVDNFLRAGKLEGKYNAIKNMPEYTWIMSLCPKGGILESTSQYKLLGAVPGHIEPARFVIFPVIVTYLVLRSRHWE